MENATGRDEERVRAFVEHFGATLEASGISRMASRMLSALLVDPDGRMTSAEIQETLGCSAAAVSSASQYLIRIGSLRRERDPGSRRDVFVVPGGVWESALLHKDTTLRAMRDLLAEGQVAVGTESDAAFRLRMLDEMYQVLEDVMDDALARWRVRRDELEAERARAR